MDGSDNSDWETEQVFKKLKPNANYKFEWGYCKDVCPNYDSKTEEVPKDNELSQIPKEHNSKPLEIPDEHLKYFEVDYEKYAPKSKILKACQINGMFKDCW